MDTFRVLQIDRAGWESYSIQTGSRRHISAIQPTFTLHFPTCSCCESAENLKPVSKRPIFLCRSEYSLCRRTRTSTATYEFGLSCVCNHGTVNCNQIFRGLKIHIFICIQKDFSQETLEHILCVLIWSERLGAQPEEEARGSDEQMLARVSRSIVSCEGNHETVSQFRFVTSKICFHTDFHYQLSQNFNSDIFFIQLNIPLSFWCILICIY